MTGEPTDATRRTRLASERTFLSWLRGGLAAIAVGIGAGSVVPGVSNVTTWPYVALGIGYIRSSAISFLQQPDAATAAGLKATNQPCGTNAATSSVPGPTTAATPTSAPAPTVTAPSA